METSRPDDIFAEAERLMQKGIDRVKHEYTRMHAGRATPNMLSGLNINCYNSSTPLQQIATIQAPDAHTLRIKPFDKNLIEEIEKAILKSHLNLNPQNDGEIISIHLPHLSEERRREMVKKVKKEAENAKVIVRNARKDMNERLKKTQKEGEISEDELKRHTERVQQLTDKYVSVIDKLFADKEADIMKI